MEIIGYEEKYDEAIKNIDSVIYFNIKYHQDVISESVCLAVDKEEVLGVGFLKAGATFLKVEREALPYYFIHAEYLACEKLDAESQVLASGMLLEELKYRFDLIQKNYPNRRLILRLFCNAEKTAYLEFLMSYGFRPMRISPIMVYNLLTDNSVDDENLTEQAANDGIVQSDRIILKNGEILEIREMNPEDEFFAGEYTITNREAFEVEDSINELRFTMGGQDAHVYAVMKGKRVIAALTTWCVFEGRSATENIFCAKDYRNKGVTSTLIKYVLGILKNKGYETASLTVFGDNQPAMQLYLKLGYEVEGSILECHYERDYKNIGY